MGLISFAVKNCIAGGLVYYTIDEGLWSKPEESVKFYGKIHNAVVPYIKENVPKQVTDELPDLPSTSDISNFFRKNWNCGVMTSMKFLANLPKHVSNGVDSLMSQPAISDMLKNVSAPTDSSKKM